MGPAPRLVSGPILILTCQLDHPVEGIVKMRVYGDPETWPGLSSGARVSAEGVTEEIERNGKVHSFDGTFMSDSLGITGNFSMMGVTYMIFDFNQNQSNQHIKVINRWHGDYNDFEMDCIHY